METATVISKDGTRIAFDQSGSGPALILVDGAICYRGFGPMRPLSALLAPHFTVFAYDRRGRGDSGNTLPYAVEREIEDIDALIRQAGGSAFVYGTSSGAALALRAAAHGLAIKKLVMYEPPFNPDNSPAARQELVKYTTRLTELLAADCRGDAVALFMNRVGTPAEAVAGMRQAPVWPMFEAVAPTLAYDDAILGHSVPTDVAAQVTTPTLVMAGGATYPFMHETAHMLEAAMPNAQRRTLDGQTHDAAPEAVAPVLVEFFAG
jgi:pimeloyl-ACP methyl ester carboxylesterase